MVTDNNSFVVGLSVNEIYEKLDDRFIFTQRSCIANKNRIQKFEWVNKEFILDTGDRVKKLSKKYKKEIEKQWKKK